MKYLILILIILIFFYFISNINENFIIEHNNYEFVIGAAFKNEGNILDEWIRHYKYHGVDHIYLINDGSNDNFELILEKYINEGYVTLYNNSLKIDKYPRQKYLYEYYFKPVLNTSKWWAIIDLDEFMYSPNDINLKNIINKYNDYDQIHVKWKMFGSNGHIEQPKFVVPSFTKRKYDDNNINGKSIIRSESLINFDVHLHNITGKIINIENNDIIINHYAIQSWNFFEKVKMTRGDINKYADHIGMMRDKKYFDEYDYKDIEDFILAKQNLLLYV